MALHALQHDPRYEVVRLLSTTTEGYNRLSMHGVRRVLFEQPAAALGLPFGVVTIPPECINSIYESRMEAALLGWKERSVCRVAFGDIFLEDLRVS
jgi:diphthamide synthase (EF-2-diphthine--ammonia ligase)